VSVDADLHAGLLKEFPKLRNDLIAHTYEHSLEVQLPFLQILAPECSFVAICVGTTDYETLESLGHAMARVIQSCPEPVLMVASSDMNHYESAQVAQDKDRHAIDRMLALDPPGLYRVVIEKDITMCGFAPTVAVLTACRDLGATRGHVIRYTNSGEVSGEFDRVVAYAGLAVT
jgi:AmmeMemoRadiSam system protein B